MEAKRSISKSRIASYSAGMDRGNKFLFRLIAWGALLILLTAGTSVWLATTAFKIRSELESAAALQPALRESINADDPAQATQTVEAMIAHTSAARAAGNDPVWTAARSVPLIGANFEAVSEIATAADDVTRLGAAPLAEAFQALDWKELMPSPNGVKWERLDTQIPKLISAAYAVKTSEERLRGINPDPLLPEVALPLRQATTLLTSLRASLDTAADAATVVPAMLGQEGSRTYLLMVQNNAESRSSGGIPGALAVLGLDKGKLTLRSQSSAGAVGLMSPIVPVDPEQQQIYSGRVGKFMQDVNLTPDFPTAASTARAMWERKTGQRVNGVISIDPVALGYILDATGPIEIRQPELVVLAESGLPTELTGQNVVQTLLSDVYSKIEQPRLQDAYFAGVAQEIFAALADGQGNSKGLIEGLTRGTAEGRVMLWSALAAEQSIIAKYTLSGSIAGPSVAPAQFGVYFNDGTGAKMDYYVKRSVQLVKACPRDGYEEVTVRITNSNTAPKDAATSLPAYVTGDGAYGVPPGSVQTNIVAYGPVQAQIESAKVDGKKTNFAPYLHSNRPVGVLAIRLAPGESKTVEYTFGKIVQHTEPSVVVTPTVQPVKDVILPSVAASCS